AGLKSIIGTPSNVIGLHPNHRSSTSSVYGSFKNPSAPRFNNESLSSFSDSSYPANSIIEPSRYPDCQGVTATFVSGNINGIRGQILGLFIVIEYPFPG